MFCTKKLIMDTKENYSCQTIENDISQQKQKEKLKSLICVKKQFSQEKSVNSNLCVDETSSTVNEIPSGCATRSINSHDYGSSKSYRPEECFTVDHCHKLSNIFVDVGSDHVGSDWLCEEDDICKVSSEILSADYKDIDYRLVKSVQIEDIQGSSRKNDISVHNLDASPFNTSDICTSNDRHSLATNHIYPKIKEELVKEPNSRDYDARVGEEEYVNKLVCVREERPFACTICGKAFTRLSHCTEHKRIHTGEKPFGCTICGKTFTQPGSLTAHKRIHTGEKPFSCTTCGKAFRQLCGLTGHKRIHTGEKPFGCTICGKSFSLKNLLICHKRIHKGEKPFGCTTCGKAFRQLGGLTRHKRIHTGEKPFG